MPFFSVKVSNLNEMPNQRPSDTGLPMTIWCSTKGNSKHDIRIKVSLKHGSKVDPSQFAIVALRPSIVLLHGDLPTSDFELIKIWLNNKENYNALIDLWEGKIDYQQFDLKIKKI